MRRGLHQRPLFRVLRWEFAAASVLVALPVSGAADPGKAALDFLKELPARSQSIEEATAISAETTKGRRREISLQLGALAKSLHPEGLEVIDVRTEPPLAGVLIGQTDLADPTAVDVHPVALLEKDGRWCPAPLPASFDNTGIDYQPGLAAPVRELERWLRLESASLLEKLRRRSLDRLAARIDAVPPPPATPAGVAMTFLLTLAEAEPDAFLPRALRLLGGINVPLSDAQSEALHLLVAARHDPEARPPQWDIVTDPAALHAIVDQEISANRATVRIGTFLPSSGAVREPRSHLLVFDLQRPAADAPWKLLLPAWLRSTEPLDSENPADARSLAGLPGALLARHPATPAPTPEGLARSIRQALAQGGLRPLIPLVARPDSLTPARIFGQLDDLQSNFQPAGPLLPLVLAVHQDGADACLLISDFDSRRPDIRRNLIRRFHLRETAEGWLLHPILDQSQLQLPPTLAQWADAHEKLSLADHLAALTRGTGFSPADAPPSSPEAARTCVETWLDATARTDLSAALATATWIADERGPQNLLRQLAQETLEPASREILATHQAGPWTAVSVRHTPRGEADPYLLLYPVATTPDGPRLLAEATLFHPDTRSRNFLNLAALKRLSRLIDADALAALEDLLARHSQLAAP